VWFIFDAAQGIMKSIGCDSKSSPRFLVALLALLDAVAGCATFERTAEDDRIWTRPASSLPSTR
jgi:hypothetical protein